MEYYRRLISLTTLDRKKKSLPSSPLRSLRPRVYNPKHTTKQIARGTPKDRKDGWVCIFLWHDTLRHTKECNARPGRVDFLDEWF
jgi:hypothetical protein